MNQVPVGGDVMEATLKRVLKRLEDKVRPSHTALVVVDVQNDFCAKGGMLDREGLDITRIQEMVPRLIHLIEKAREAGLTIIYIQSVYNAKANYLSDVWLEQSLRGWKGRFIEYPVCGKDDLGGELYEGIKPLPGEFVVHKHRYNAFESSDLDLILRSNAIRTLIMTGASTNICVETTARAGFVKDYYIVFLDDCTATVSEDLHKSTLFNIDRWFGQVVNSNDVIKCWQPPPKITS